MPFAATRYYQNLDLVEKTLKKVTPACKTSILVFFFNEDNFPDIKKEHFNLNLKKVNTLNAFIPNALFLYPLNTSENKQMG